MSLPRSHKQHSTLSHIARLLITVNSALVDESGEQKYEIDFRPGTGSQYISFTFPVPVRQNCCKVPPITATANVKPSLLVPVQ